MDSFCEPLAFILNENLRLCLRILLLLPFAGISF